MDQGVEHLAGVRLAINPAGSTTSRRAYTYQVGTDAGLIDYHLLMDSFEWAGYVQS